MEVFLDAIEDMAEQDVAAAETVVSDAEIDRMIDADVLAAEKKELDGLKGLAAEIDAELSRAEPGKEK